MGNDHAMNEVIVQEMEEISPDDFLRSGMSFNDFTGEFSTTLSQAAKDKTLLVGSGMDYATVTKGHAYLEFLMKEHGARVNAEADESQDSKEFKDMMPVAIAEKKCLMAAGRYITFRSGKSGNVKVYDMVSEGHGDVDTLTDNMTLVGFMRNNKELASQVKPGGITIDEDYLKKVEENALSLMKLRSAAITARDDAKEQVERQNKLITLCILTQREIKLFAEMAFFNDTERYRKFYASAVRRKMGKNAASKAIE